MHKLLALDQSSRTTGWAYFEDDQLKDYGHFTANNEDLGERLFYIKNQVNNLISKYEIDELVFEDIQYQKRIGGIENPDTTENIKVFKMLAMVFGIIHELAVDIKLPRVALLPVVWKSGLKIKGKTRPQQKKDSQRFAKETYNLTDCTEDEADAICIGTYIVKNNIKIEQDHDWSD